MAGPNIPEEVRGFGKLGKFVRAILKYSISAHISSFIVENYPAGTTASPTVTLTPTASGTIAKLKLSAGGTGSAAPHFPFELTDASTVGSAEVRVRYGTVNSIAPDGMAPGDSPVFTIAVSDGDSVYLRATWDTSSAVITDLDILVGTVPADDTSDDGVYCLEIGSVAVNSVPATPIVGCVNSIQTSQVLSVCRNWFSDPATYGASWGPA